MCYYTICIRYFLSVPFGTLLFLEIMAKKKIQEYIAEYLDEYGKENGYELSRCEFVKEGSTWYLRVYIDRIIDGKYDYMTSDDCALVSRYLSDCLDKDDPIEQNYYLEVSSPGLDRLLVSDKDFERFKGSVVFVKLYESIDGKKQFEAVLHGLEDGILSFTTEDEKEISIPKDKVAKVNLVVII